MSIDFKKKYFLIILFLIFGYFLLIKCPFLLKGHTFCLFKSITGYPCPACGSLRASFKLFDGRIIESILINPLALISNVFFIFSMFWMVYDIFKNKESFLPFLKKNWNKTSKIALFIIIIINWIWNIYKGL